MDTLSFLPAGSLVLKVILFANTEWYLYNFRRSLATALREAGHELLLLSPPGPYGDKLRDLGFRWIAAPMERRSLNPLRELSLLIWLRRLIKQEQADLVHSFTIKCAVYGSLAARFADTPGRVNAVTGMGYVFTGGDFRARLLRPLVRGLLRVALDGQGTRLILQNPDDVALFREAGLVEMSRVRLIQGSGVDCNRYEKKHTHAVGNPLRVLLASRLLWDKGLAEYASAARELKAKGRAIHFLLAGLPDSGNPAAVPKEAIQAWVHEGILEWLGHVDDMPTLLSSVDVMVLPSYREGLPKGLIEAAACGLPLITTNVAGCREVVTHEVDGLLVPVHDAEALAQAIARLQDDPALAARLGEAAREKAQAQFDERVVIEQTMAVYHELIPWKI